jgi:hypothetical protein
MVHWFIKHSRNLQYYGIDTNYAMCKVFDKGAVLSSDELEYRKIIMALKDDINVLKESIKRNDSIIENMSDEKMLVLKVDHLKRLGDSSLSMDSIMKEIKDNKGGGRKLQDMYKSTMRTSYNRFW